ncbi:hypothetical protein V2J52_02810 [Georgenia sp. MJ173]|uniref:hypothetical protein n=1 Tax=Georgenia sunbinii TaxID=3117728 RepID=UPI002F25FA78
MTNALTTALVDAFAKHSSRLTGEQKAALIATITAQTRDDDEDDGILDTAETDDDLAGIFD